MTGYLPCPPVTPPDKDWHYLLYAYLPFPITASELSVGDMGTVATSFNRSRYTTLPSSTPQSYKQKVQTLYVYLSLDVCHYLAERRASTFPLDNLTKVSIDSFS